jgi:hypothetical protein
MPKRKSLLLKGLMSAGRGVAAKRAKAIAEKRSAYSSFSFKFIPTSVPTWVLAAVRKWALDGLFFIHEKDKEVAQRLLTDKRMVRVWRELKRDKTKLFHQPDKVERITAEPRV